MRNTIARTEHIMLAIALGLRIGADMVGMVVVDWLSPLPSASIESSDCLGCPFEIAPVYTGQLENNSKFSVHLIIEQYSMDRICSGYVDPLCSLIFLWEQYLNSHN